MAYGNKSIYSFFKKETTIMKKKYMKPVTQVNNVQMENVCGALTLSTTYAAEGSVGLGKERGTRTESDDFDDLW